TDTPAARRHPTIGDRVVLGVGASVLGPVRVGHDTLIGAHSLVLHDVPAHSCVRATGTQYSTPPESVSRPAPSTKDHHVGDTSLDHLTHRPHSPGGPAPLR